MSIFYNDGMRNRIIGLLNSKVAVEILKVLSPTMNYEVGHISSVPVLKFPQEDVKQVNSCIEIVKSDWNSTETAWNFEKHQLV